MGHTEEKMFAITFEGSDDLHPRFGVYKCYKLWRISSFVPLL